MALEQALLTAKRDAVASARALQSAKSREAQLESDLLKLKQEAVATQREEAERNTKAVTELQSQLELQRTRLMQAERASEESKQGHQVEIARAEQISQDRVSELQRELLALKQQAEGDKLTQTQLQRQISHLEEDLVETKQQAKVADGEHDTDQQARLLQRTKHRHT